MSEVDVEEVTIPDTHVMNIHEKLTRIQNDLLGINIPKSGHNQFGHFDYHTLNDLLPPILELCLKYECTLYFDFPPEKGQLYLINWKDKEDKICVEVPFATLEKLPKMNWAQSSGTYQTYMKRYLILHTFDIIEEEVIDSLQFDNNTNGKKKGSERVPASVSKIIKKCKEENPDVECDMRLLNKVRMNMLKNKELTKKEAEEAFNYIKKNK